VLAEEPCRSAGEWFVVARVLWNVCHSSP
jgi:hypothetical protein